MKIFTRYYRSKKYCPVLVAQNGFRLLGKYIDIALLRDQNRKIRFGLIEPIMERMKFLLCTQVGT